MLHAMACGMPHEKISHHLLLYLLYCAPFNYSTTTTPVGILFRLLPGCPLGPLSESIFTFKSKMRRQWIIALPLSTLPLCRLLSCPQGVLGLAATGTPPKQKVCVIGGTHGNEYTGIWCIKAIQENKDLQDQLAHDFPSLDISTVFANPPAHLANKRFLDRDLNRAFSVDDLYSNNNDDNDKGDWEMQRARELDQLLGPKSADTPAVDVAVDLHSTTCNMGTTLIFPEQDVVMAQAAAYILARMPSKANARILVEPLPPQPYRPNVGSCAKHDFTIEVGPCPQGVLRHDAVENTQTALHYFFEFLHRRNQDSEQVYRDLGNDFRLVMQIVKGSYQIPCFRTAPADDPVMSLENGAMTGKIGWPSDPDNDNFPMYMVHKDVQDKDFEPLRVGDPLFVRQDNGETIVYDGSHGPVVHLIFVNEAGYYYASSGTGLGVAYPGWLDLQTGNLVEELKSSSYR